MWLTQERAKAFHEITLHSHAVFLLIELQADSSNWILLRAGQALFIHFFFHLRWRRNIAEKKMPKDGDVYTIRREILPPPPMHSCIMNQWSFYLFLYCTILYALHSLFHPTKHRSDALKFRIFKSGLWRPILSLYCAALLHSFRLFLWICPRRTTFDWILVVPAYYTRFGGSTRCFLFLFIFFFFYYVCRCVRSYIDYLIFMIKTSRYD